MLRIRVDFPKQKVVNMLAEYEDYLEETGLVDIKDVKRRNKINLKHCENDEEVKSITEGDEDNDPTAPKIDFNDIPGIQTTRGISYHNVLKDMITRMELDGTLGKRRDYGRATVQGKFNEKRDEEYYYNLDDEFIDDNALMNNDSMLKDFSQQELINGEDDIEKYYNQFEFLTDGQMKNYSSVLKAKKRKRLEDEQISDPKINEKLVQLEKAVNEK